ncbi:MAG: hypothetical protein AB8H79_07810 [Myxococcota bacterium]
MNLTRYGDVSADPAKGVDAMLIGEERPSPTGCDAVSSRFVPAVGVAFEEDRIVGAWKR